MKPQKKGPAGGPRVVKDLEFKRDEYYMGLFGAAIVRYVRPYAHVLATILFKSRLDDDSTSYRDGGADEEGIQAPSRS